MDFSICRQKEVVPQVDTISSGYADRTQKNYEAWLRPRCCTVVRRAARSSGLTVRLCSRHASYSTFIPSAKVVTNPPSITRFILRKTSGTHDSISLANVRHVGRSSSGMTTRLTSPQASAFSAERKLPVSDNSFAR